MRDGLAVLLAALVAVFRMFATFTVALALLVAPRTAARMALRLRGGADV